MIRSMFVFCATMLLGVLIFQLGQAIVKSLNGNMATFLENFSTSESIVALIVAGLLLAYAAFPKKTP